ncbi:MAG: DUF4982 domain-containing protein [Bacteroidaceae bacterium]|nr:DUF4982 domain-containing protein [Bacteroidaceae bacterium]
MKRNYALAIIAMLLSSVGALAQSTWRRSFNDGWTFSLNGGEAQEVRLPHDWAIKGDFDPANPSGTGGGALPGGMGVYRKRFCTDMKHDKGMRYRLDFDGVYMNASVYVNGSLVGRRPYGYVSFGFDITPYLNPLGEYNDIEVRVDNTEQPNSRWYSGCGIYRNVWLTCSPAVHIAHDGVEVKYTLRNLHLDANGSKRAARRCMLTVNTTVVNDGNKKTTVMLYNTITKDNSPFMRSSAKKSVTIAAHDTAVVKLSIPLENVELWSVTNPCLYKVKSHLAFRTNDDSAYLGLMFGAVGGAIAGAKMSNNVTEDIDCYTTQVGFRKAQFTPDGFLLNGQPMQIQGVCMHHDLGCLGAAVNRRAIERQVEILKGMGINGIRCSHNPPAPELLDVCDSLGMLVMDEAFDMWRKAKTKHDYARYFNEWHERDLRDFMLRDRNHPSIVIWSVGNEVLEQWTDADADTLTLEQANLLLNFGHSADQLAKDDGTMSVNSLLTRKLVALMKEYDNRPITAGCNEPNEYNHLFKADALDVIGFNYHNQNIPDVPRRFPGKPFIITESNSALMTRGYYRMPSDSMYIFPKRWDIPFHDESFACSSYENCHVPWGNTNEENLLLMRRYPWICGQFVWTGFDYIGEPTPYGWPARSSYFGIVDLAGFPKDVYYLYKAELTHDDVLHLFPHWTWTPDQLPADGMIDLWAYYNNADEVELFVNGKSQGTRHKTDDCLHVVWRVKYEAGEVQAISRKDGKVVKVQTIRTAGAPAQIRLTPDRTELRADGTDLSFVTVEVLDKDGNLCPWADNLVSFDVTGSAFIAGVDNGLQTSLERFADTRRHAFNGKCLVVLQNNGKAGAATLKVTSEGLKEASSVVSFLK